MLLQDICYNISIARSKYIPWYDGRKCYSKW